jgi:hypothetical protein
VPGPLDAYHNQLTAILKTFVVEEPHFLRSTDTYPTTLFKYGAAQKSPQWVAYKKTIVHAEMPKIRAASDRDRLAFWINCYNACVIDSVLEAYPLSSLKPAPGYPVNSVQSLPDFWQKPHPIARHSYSLREIEKKLSEFEDPRAFLAITQAAVDSPPFLKTAYTGSLLDEQLNHVCGSFLTNPANCRIDRAANKLYLTPIFEWHRDDFQNGIREISPELKSYPPESRAIAEFVYHYLPADDRQYLKSKIPVIVFNDFDWSLNDFQGTIGGIAPHSLQTPLP